MRIADGNDSTTQPICTNQNKFIIEIAVLCIKHDDYDDDDADDELIESLFCTTVSDYDQYKIQRLQNLKCFDPYPLHLQWKSIYI